MASRSTLTQCSCGEPSGITIAKTDPAGGGVHMRIEPMTDLRRHLDPPARHLPREHRQPGPAHGSRVPGRRHPRAPRLPFRPVAGRPAYRAAQPRPSDQPHAARPLLVVGRARSCVWSLVELAQRRHDCGSALVRIELPRGWVGQVSQPAVDLQAGRRSRPRGLRGAATGRAARRAERRASR
jgi:hypothetical protein